MEQFKPSIEQQIPLLNQEATALLQLLKEIGQIILKNSQPVQSRKRKRTALETLQQQGYRIHSEYCKFLDQWKNYAKTQHDLMVEIRKLLGSMTKLELNKGKDASIVQSQGVKLSKKAEHLTKQEETLVPPSPEPCQRQIERELSLCYQSESFPELEEQRLKLLAGATASLMIASGMKAVTNYHPLLSIGLIGGTIATCAYPYANINRSIVQEKAGLVRIFRSLGLRMNDAKSALESFHRTLLTTYKAFYQCVVSTRLTLAYQDNSLNKVRVDLHEQTKAADGLIKMYQNMIKQAEKYKTDINFSLLLSEDQLDDIIPFTKK